MARRDELAKNATLDDPICFFYQIKNAVRVFEYRQLLRLRVGGVAEMTASARRAGIAQLADRFSRKIVRVLLAALRLILLRPVADNFADIGQRALRKDYTEVLRGHRSCTFARNSSPS